MATEDDRAWSERANAGGRRAVALVGLFFLNVCVVTLALPALGWLSNALTDWSGSAGSVSKFGPTLWYPSSADLSASIADYWNDVTSIWEEVSLDSAGTWLRVGIVSLIAVTPVLLVAPIVGSPAISGTGRSMRSSVFGASIMAAGLTLGVVCAVVELLFLATTTKDQPLPATWQSLQEIADFDGYAEVLAVLLGAWTLVGALWAYALRAAGRSRDPNGVLRLFRWLLAGTAIELALAVSTLALARRRDECICAWSSFWAIIYGLSALLILCGPALILLSTRKARAGWARFACRRCGYPRRVYSTVCSECGLEDP